MQDRSTRQVGSDQQFPPWSSALEQLRRDVSASPCLDGILRDRPVKGLTTLGQKRLLEDCRGLRNLRGCKIQRT